MREGEDEESGKGGIICGNQGRRAIIKKKRMRRGRSEWVDLEILHYVLESFLIMKLDRTFSIKVLVVDF